MLLKEVTILYFVFILLVLIFVIGTALAFLSENKGKMIIVSICLLVLCFAPTFLTSSTYAKAQNAKTEVLDATSITYNCSVNDLEYTEDKHIHIKQIVFEDNVPKVLTFEIIDGVTNNIRVNNELDNDEIIVEEKTENFQVNNGVTERQEFWYNTFHLDSLATKLSEDNVHYYIDKKQYSSKPSTTVFMNENTAKRILIHN